MASRQSLGYALQPHQDLLHACCTILQISHAAEKNAFLRSEEHTSELQSRFDLVCRLLLEKKKEVSASYLRLLCHVILLICVIRPFFCCRRCCVTDVSLAS